MEALLKDLTRQWRIGLAAILEQNATATIEQKTFAEVFQLVSFLLGGQAVLASKIDVSRPTVSRYCDCKMPRSNAYACYLVFDKIPKVLREQN